VKSIFHIKSDRIVESIQPVLLMEAGEKHICFGIMNQGNRFLQQAAYYIAEGDESNLSEKVIEHHPELHASFNQTLISYHFRDSVLIPADFFNHDNATSLLNSLFDSNGNEIVISESVAEWQLHNVYRISKSLHNSFGKHFTSGKFWHTYSVALKNCLSSFEGANLLIDFKPNEFSVLLISNNNFQLAQIFDYTVPADVLYHLLKICMNFSLLQEEVHVMVSGLIEQQSGLYEELHKYFLQIEFGSANGRIQMDESFYDYPVHYFSSLYKLAACVS
jgi:Protein of unknown function (DUF3822)